MVIRSEKIDHLQRIIETELVALKVKQPANLAIGNFIVFFRNLFIDDPLATSLLNYMLYNDWEVSEHVAKIVRLPFVFS